MHDTQAWQILLSQFESRGSGENTNTIRESLESSAPQRETLTLMIIGVVRLGSFLTVHTFFNETIGFFSRNFFVFKKTRLMSAPQI